MKVSSRKLLLHIFIGQILSICFFGVKAMLDMDKSIAATFQLEWVIARMLESVVLYYIPVCLSSIVLSVSVFNSSHTHKGMGSGKLQGGVLVVLLGAMVCYVALLGFVLGQARTWQIQISTVSKEFDETMKAALDSRNQGKSREALSRSRLALQLIPNDPTALKFRDGILRNMETATLDPAKAAEKTESEKPKEFAGYSYAEIVEKGRFYLEEGDYFTALYFLGIAEKEREDDEVLRLIIKAREGADSLDFDADHSKQHARYLVKREAVLDLIPNGMWEKAYFELLKAEDLAREEGLAPEPAVGIYLDSELKNLPLGGKYADPEVRLYLPLVLKNLQEISFFSDEFDGISGKNGQGSLVYLNAEENGLRQYLFFRAIYPGQNRAYYVFAPEFILVDGEGRIRAQVQAETGKIIDHQLLLRAIDRQDPEILKEARIIQGNMDPNLLNSIDLAFTGSELYGFSASVGAGGNLSFAEQISLFEPLNKAGLDIRPVELSLLDYLVRAFSAISLGLLAWIAGTSLRNRSLSKPVMLIILSIPLVVLASILMLDFYYHLISIASHLIYASFGFWNAIWINVAIQAAQVLVCLFIFAGISAREE